MPATTSGDSPMRQMVIERSAIAGQSDCLPSALVVGRSPPGAPAVNSPMDGIRVIGAPKSRTMLPRYDSEITLEVVTARRDSSPLAELLPSDNCWPRSSRPAGVQRIREIRQRLPVEPARFEHSKEHAFRFGRFSLIKHSRQLLAGGTPVRLGNRAIDVLFVLSEASGQLVTKDELMSRAWPTVTVEENCLQFQISALRKALGKDRDFINTVSGRGYRFIAEVSAEGTETGRDAESVILERNAESVTFERNAESVTSYRDAAKIVRLRLAPSPGNLPASTSDIVGRESQLL